MIRTTARPLLAAAMILAGAAALTAPRAQAQQTDAAAPQTATSEAGEHSSQKAEEAHEQQTEMKRHCIQTGSRLPGNCSTAGSQANGKEILDRSSRLGGQVPR